MKTQYPPNADTDNNSLYSSDAFRMYVFKVLPCSKRFCHDWVTCPFAHPAEKAARRDPRAYVYTGVACPDQKKNASCPRGDSCTFAHNVFEYHLHPSRYRTQLCNDGANCSRKICFFAHSMDELRVSSVKVVPPDSAANKLGSPSSSGKLDTELFGQEDVLGSLKNRSSTSPVSPLYGDPWDATPGSDTPSRRSSLQLQQKQQQRHRMSLDQLAMRPQHQALMRHQRHSVDLASELQLQQLQLSAMKAQLQLQQSALQSLGVSSQPDPSAQVAQLAQALAHLQLASNLAGSEQLLPAALPAAMQQQQQQLVPNLTQALMQQVMLQQQAQAQAQQVQAQVQQQVQGQLLQQLQSQAAQAAPQVPDLSVSGLGMGMLMQGQQASMTPAYSLPVPVPGAGAGMPDFGLASSLSKMASLPGPDLSPLPGLCSSPLPTMGPQSSFSSAGLSPPVSFESGLFSRQASAFAGVAATPAGDGDDGQR